MDLLDVGLWETVADLAKRKGIARQSLHERVDRLEADGLITVRREGRSKLINVAEFDRAVGEVGDAVKEAAFAARDPEVDADKNPALRDHQARAAQYGADLKFLDLEERLGRLIPVAEVEEAAQRAAEAIVRVIDRMPSYAEAIAAGVAKDGSHGARGALKEMAREIRQGVAEAMGVLAGAAEPLTIEPSADNEPA